jgi:uncharacterized DUF497 family protein
LRYICAWKPEKARENRRNYHISFERAATIRHDSWALSIVAIARSHKEGCWITLGWDRNGDLFVVRLRLRTGAE